MPFIPTIPYSGKKMSSTLQKKSRLRKSPQPLRFVVLDSDRHWLNELGKDKTVVCGTPDQVLKVLDRTDANSLWISSHSERTEELAKTLVELISQNPKRRQTFGRLLTLEAAKTQVRPTSGRTVQPSCGCFSRIQETPARGTLCSFYGIISAERRDVFIGGVVNLDLGTAVLVRGNFDLIVVPLSLFRPSGRATPDFKKFELTDYGHTLKFGELRSNR